MPTDVVIVSAVRTPIATAYKGSLAGVDAFALAEVVIGEAVKRAGIPADQIEDMGFGESFQGGGNVGRNAAVRLGLISVPGVATQRWCASGMSGVQWVAANIAAGMIDVGIGGSTESMSPAPGTTRSGELWMSSDDEPTPEVLPFNTSLTVGENTARMA